MNHLIRLDKNYRLVPVRPASPDMSVEQNMFSEPYTLLEHHHYYGTALNPNTAYQTNEHKYMQEKIKLQDKYLKNVVELFSAQKNILDKIFK